MAIEPGPTRLAFCITDLDAGGAERALVQLVTRLDPAQWQPFVFCLSPAGTLVDDLTRADVPVTCLNVRGGSRKFLVVRRLARHFQELQPALVQTFLWHANLTGRLAARMAGVPIIVSGIRVAEKRSRVPLWLDRATQRMVACHVCVSNDVAQFSIKRGRLRADKIEVIPNGVDAARYRNAQPADLSEFGIPAGSQIILFVGRLDPQKRPLLFLQSLEHLVRMHEGVHAVLVGDGVLLIKLRAWIAAHHLQKHVRLAGWRPDIPELMKAADCLVLPSRWEGMPNVVLEAMASGLPVVATQVEGISDLLRHGENGLLVSSDSPEKLSTAIASVLEQPERARAMANVAQQEVLKGFTWEAMVARYAQLYRRLLGR